MPNLRLAPVTIAILPEIGHRTSFKTFTAEDAENAEKSTRQLNPEGKKSAQKSKKFVFLCALCVSAVKSLFRGQSSFFGILLMAYSARAVIVRLGLMPGLAGTIAPSTTYRPG